MRDVSGLPRLISRVLLGSLVLLELGTVWLAMSVPSLVSVLAAVGAAIFFIVPCVGAYVAERRPRNPIGWIFLAAGVALGVFLFSGSYAYAALTLHRGSLPGGVWLGWVEGWSWAYSVPLVASFGILLFPDGHLPGKRWRPVALLSCAMLALLTFGLAFSTQLVDWNVTNPLGPPSGVAALADAVQNVALPLMFPVTTLTAFSMAYRRRGADERVRPVLLLAAVAATLIALSYLGCIVWAISGANTVSVFAVEAVPVVALAVTTVIGIVWYDLFDLRVVASRTLVYGTLTVLVVAGYLAASAAVGMIVKGVPTQVLAGVAVALAALPLRDVLQRAVNRLVYGDRDDPYRAISKLTDRLDAVAEATDMLPMVVKTLAESLCLPYVAVELRGELMATSGAQGSGVLKDLPLLYQGECLGRLRYETRSRAERFGTADLRLLNELARHVAVAARQVVLTTDLVRSREQLIRAREEERRRIRRELHDGVGPNLAGIALGIDRARRAVRSSPGEADQALQDLRLATQESVAEIRRLAYDLRPPALDQLGLLSALREQTQRLGGEFNAPDVLPELPAAVEVAAYRITLEALTNAARHSRAADCRVRLSVEGGLRVEVEDDGVGLPDTYTAGVGINSMRERAAELGGDLQIERRVPRGTRVVAVLPLAS
jgi:two-component system, NarL family, sensor kinase